MIRIGILILAGLSTLNAQVRVRPGMWENTVTSNGKAVTHSSCLTTEAAAVSNGPAGELRAAFEKSIAKTSCSLKDFKIEGNSITDTMVCGKTTYVNTRVYHGGDSTETTATRTEGGVAKVSTIKSKRTGDCP